MKKLLHILTSILALASCSKEAIESFGDENKVKVNVSVLLEGEAQTKAFADKPDVRTLHLAVFDDQGYFCEYVDATEKSQKAVENAVLYNYEAELETSKDKRVIHFIANGPDEMEFGNEVSLVAALTKDRGTDADAYWQRIELNRISRVSKTNSAADEYTATALNGVTLIRNFARFKLTETADRFELLGYMLVNDPTKGSIAPYNTKTGKFQANYLTADEADKISTDLGYRAFTPISAGRDGSHDDSRFVGPDTFIYMFESLQTGAETDAYVLAKGKYDSDNDGSFDDEPDSYYKILLRNTDDKPFDILRNFSYVFNIKTVNRAGYTDIDNAAASDGMGDLSTIGSTEGLNNISDGKSQLVVSYTSIIMVDETHVQFRYKFIPDITKDVADNDKVTITGQTGGEVIKSFTEVTNNSGDGYKVFDVEPYPTSAQEKEQTITLEALASDGTTKIVRTVKFILKQKSTMYVHCIPSSVKEGVGETFTYLIEIPEMMTESIFPLDFKIESNQISIAPNTAVENNRLPVYSGSSIIDSNKKSFGFIRTLSLDEYKSLPESSYHEGFKQFECYFSTTKEKSACRIYAQNKYFNFVEEEGMSYASLGNHTMKTFKNLKFKTLSGTEITSVGAEETISFSFELSDYAPDGEKILVTLEGLTGVDEEKDILRHLSGNTYEYNPAGSKTGTFKLYVTGETKPASVKLECAQFYPSDTKTIDVTKSVGKITLTADKTKVEVGQQVQLVAESNSGGAISFTFDSSSFSQQSTWTEGNKTYIILNALKQGRPTVKATLAETTTHTGTSASKTISIARRPNVTIDVNYKSFQWDDTETYTLNLDGYDGTPVLTVSDPTVATASYSGNGVISVKGLKPGEVKITMTLPETETSFAPHYAPELQAAIGKRVATLSEDTYELEVGHSTMNSATIQFKDKAKGTVINNLTPTVEIYTNQSKLANNAAVVDLSNSNRTLTAKNPGVVKGGVTLADNELYVLEDSYKKLTANVYAWMNITSTDKIDADHLYAITTGTSGQANMISANANNTTVANATTSWTGSYLSNVSNLSRLRITISGGNATIMNVAKNDYSIHPVESNNSALTYTNDTNVWKISSTNSNKSFTFNTESGFWWFKQTRYIRYDSGSWTNSNKSTDLYIYKRVLESL